MYGRHQALKIDSILNTLLKDIEHCNKYASQVYFNRLDDANVQQQAASKIQLPHVCCICLYSIKGGYRYNNSGKEVQSYYSLLCTNLGFILGTYNNAFYFFAYKIKYLLEIKYCFPQG